MISQQKDNLSNAVFFFFFIEEQKFDGSFSKNYFDTLLKRIAPDYEIRVVQPVDFERFIFPKNYTIRFLYIYFFYIQPFFLK